MCHLSAYDTCRGLCERKEGQADSKERIVTAMRNAEPEYSHHEDLQRQRVSNSVGISIVEKYIKLVGTFLNLPVNLYQRTFGNRMHLTEQGRLLELMAEVLQPFSDCPPVFDA